jgi:hypothetical protein
MSDDGVAVADEKKAGAKAPAMKLKVSEKGALSVYGLGRFPVTLDKEQWKRLLEMSGEIRAFLAEHDAELKTKGAGDDKAAAEKAAEG